MNNLKRIPFDALPEPLAAALTPRVKRLGYFGEFFQCAAHQPEALKAFVDFTELAKAGLPKKLVELVALTSASWMGNAYERNQHERLSVRAGYGREWVAAVERLDPDADGPLSDDEIVVQRFVLTVLDTKGKGATALFDPVAAIIGPAETVAVLMVLGRYVFHGLFVNTLALAPPVPSIFDDNFEG